MLTTLTCYGGKVKHEDVREFLEHFHVPSATQMTECSFTTLN